VASIDAIWSSAYHSRGTSTFGFPFGLSEFEWHDGCFFHCIEEQKLDSAISLLRQQVLAGA
jgi:hypothetical protein